MASAGSSFGKLEVGCLFFQQRGRSSGMPGRNRRLAGLVQRLHRAPDGIDARGEEISDQQVGDRATKMWVLANEFTKAEPVVELADEAPHPIHALIEVITPAAKLRFADVAPYEPVHDRIRGEFPGLQ